MSMRKLDGVRMVEEGRTDEVVRRLPALPPGSSLLKLAWWAAKCRAVANGEHVHVLEGVPEADASAIDGEPAGCREFDGTRILLTEAAMTEATLELHAKRMLREIEDWARELLEAGA